MARAHRYGAAAEATAAAYLQTLGFAIVARNFRAPDGEIDIIARDGATIVFIEVKARMTRAFGSPLSAVDHRKRARIRAVAADYLQFAAPDLKARFDVLAISGTGLRLYRNAF